MAIQTRIRRVIAVNSPTVFFLIYKSAMAAYENLGVAYFECAIGPLDVENSVFPTIQDAVDHYEPGAPAIVIAALNSNFGAGSFEAVGSIVTFDGEAIFEAIDAVQAGVTALHSSSVIPDLAADAPTDLNMSSVLPTELNAANARYNSLAGTVNSLLAVLRAAGIISAT